MKTTKLLFFGFALVFLVVPVFCPPANAQNGYQCPHCICVNGHCSWPVCDDHKYYPGYCAGIGCTSGEDCCPIADCGDCECVECNPSRCLGTIPGCTVDGCPFTPGGAENIDANNHLQPWMVDQELPAQLAAYSKTWSVVIARLQHDFSDTAEPIAVRRKMLMPNISHFELAFPELKQSVVFETKYSAQKGGWIFRCIRGLQGDMSRADILVFLPAAWSLHREEPTEHIGNGKIAPMPNVIDFPKDDNVEAQYAARLAKAQSIKEKRLPADMRDRLDAKTK